MSFVSKIQKQLNFIEQKAIDKLQERDHKIEIAKLIIENNLNKYLITRLDGQLRFGVGAQEVAEFDIEDKNDIQFVVSDNVFTVNGRIYKTEESALRSLISKNTQEFKNQRILLELKLSMMRKIIYKELSKFRAAVWRL